MKKKNFRLLLAAVLTTVMLASAMPTMAQTESVSQNGEDEIMLISADPAAASVKWTSSKLKAAKVDFTKVTSASYDKLRLSWEPLSGVDVEGMELLMDMLDEIRKTYDLSILMTTHDFSMLGRYADRVVLLREKILCKGTPLEVLNSDEFAQAFHLGGAK